VSEAARYLRLPPATLRAWVTDVDSASRVIRASGRAPVMLSFWNLVEAHVLRALRTDHGVSLPNVRSAIRYAEQSLGIERLLLSPELKTDAGRLFLDRYGALTDLAASGQLAMRALFESHLKRVEWDRWAFPVRLFPFVPGLASDAAPAIAIEASIGFGRPIVRARGIATSVIADRIDAGESVGEVARDYDISESDVSAAVLLERAA
jgi:uncharacterized protein (DUF433 family)